VTRLELLGWNSFFEAQVDRTNDAELIPARVIEEQRGSYQVAGAEGAWRAELAGRLRHEISDHGGEGAAAPCTGDWVMARVPPPNEDGSPAVVHRVLQRKTKFSRKEAGNRTAEQVIAANVDTIFLVQSLNRDLNPRRLERYLALLWESGAEPVVVLSKADLCEDRAPLLESLSDAVRGVTVQITSAVEAGGLDVLAPYLGPGRTVALVGSSGVGKSSIVNRLLGEDVMRVRDIREDDRGRHTTTSRHLVSLPGGGMLLDTPGMRTVLMWEGKAGLAQAFEDIEVIAAECKFRDCAHSSEPGCAVRAALESGLLDPARYQNYHKVGREIRHEAMKTDVKLRLEENRKWRKLTLEYRRRPDKRTMK
jgi:ribosome biogenesis GTPase / thiamine phosphate phosphatase